MVQSAMMGHRENAAQEVNKRIAKRYTNLPSLHRQRRMIQERKLFPGITTRLEGVLRIFAPASAAASLEGP
eukprot:748410-Hanusia_phi.AAC.3